MPRFYMKRFSIDGKTINLVHLPSLRTVLGGKLKTQCRRDYFYGREGNMEDALAIIEGHIAGVLKGMSNSATLPPYGTEDNRLLLIFALIQHFRTLYAAEAVNESVDKMTRLAFENHPSFQGNAMDKVKFEFTNAPQYSISLAMKNYELLLDMGCKLLRIQCDGEFVTSDNPAIFHNQLMFFRRYGGNTGIASKGLQIFLPIDPKNALMYYDRDVYRVGPAGEKSIAITNLRDVQQLNRLQVASARENVYFLNNASSVQADVKHGIRFRRPQKTQVKKYNESSSAERKSEIITMSFEDVRVTLDLTFVRLLKTAKTWRIEFQKMRQQPAIVARNLQVAKLHDEYADLVVEGKRGLGTFLEFIEARVKDSTP